MKSVRGREVKRGVGVESGGFLMALQTAVGILQKLQKHENNPQQSSNLSTSGASTVSQGGIVWLVPSGTVRAQPACSCYGGVATVASQFFAVAAQGKIERLDRNRKL